MTETTITLPGVAPHDPNDRRHDKHFRLTFRLWDYEAQFTAKVGGNCLGMQNLDSALFNVLDQLETAPDAPYRMILKKPNGDEMICDDDEACEEEWLQEMLVCAELFSVTPAGQSPGEEI
jgi:hypothetical protein